MQLTYSIYYPGGNTTALVNRLILDPALKKQINDKIMRVNPQVEQVGFLSQRSYRLEMAGGEFCGNATRCAAYYYLKGRLGKIKLKVSGVFKKLMAGIDKKGNAWTNIPLEPKLFTKKLGYTIVNLKGIGHVVLSQKPNKRLAKTVLKKLNLLESVPAAGVMFITKNRQAFQLDPFVWVRDIKTFFYETACASGTAAVGIYLAKAGKNQLEVSQPSGKTLKAITVKKVTKIISSKITGKITVIKNDLAL